MNPRTPPPSPVDLGAHAPWIRSLALRLVRDTARADDLVQETLLAALEQQPSPGKTLRPWLRSVLKRRFAFGVRSDARRRDREHLSAAPEEQPAGTDLVEKAEAHAQLVQALTRLREPYRTALLLRYYEGLAPGEIAARLGLRGATVRSHLLRGLADLRETLDREHMGDRRSWCIAFVPLAAGAPDAWTFAGPLRSFLKPLRAMHPILQLTAASGIALFAASLSTGNLDPTASVPLGTQPPVAAVTNGKALLTPTAGFPGSPRVAVAHAAGPNLASADDRIVGFVHDRETGEAIPGYAVGFLPEEGQGESEHVFTDATGRFESETLFAPGAEFFLSLGDHPDVQQVVRTQRQVMPRSTCIGVGITYDPAKVPYKFKASVGPTFKLALDAPFEIDPELLVATLEASERAPWGPLSMSYQLRAPVRPGEPLWTRFSPVHNYMIPADRPWLLRVESTDGLWAGEQEIPATYGIYPETVTMLLEPAARLDVEVIAEIKYTGLVVFAENTQDGARRILSPVADEALADGRHLHRFQLMALPAGTYQVTVSNEGVHQITGTPTLVAGQPHTEVIELEQNTGLSHIRGELRSASGSYKEPVALRLVGLASKTQHTLSWIQWSLQDGIWVAPFVFDNLPQDTYSMQVIAQSDNRCWDGLAVGSTLPRDDLVITCQDTVPIYNLKLQARDAETGDTVSEVMGSLTTTCCGASLVSGATYSAMHFIKIPVEVPFTWWVKADGYIPRFGDQSALAVTDEQGLVDVQLSPGWGARVELTDSATGDSLPGVAVRLDGALAGVTDASGYLELAAQSEPVHVDFELEGWQAVAGYSYDPLERALTGIGPRYFIPLTTTP